MKEGQVWVADLSSHNGTQLNGESLAGEQTLNDGDVLAVADFRFRVQLTARNIGRSHWAPGRADSPQRVPDVADDAETPALLQS